MTKTVTVDLADLETLIHATSVLKTIEGAFAQRQRDPFVKPHLDFTAAHDRLAAEWRNGQRAEADTVGKWDENLDSVQSHLLEILAEMKAFPSKDRTADVEVLLIKGMIELGQAADAVVWTGDKSASLTPRHDIYYVRITDRGRKKLEQLSLKGAA